VPSILVWMNAAGPFDGTIDVAFRGQMHDQVRSILAKYGANCFGVGNVSSNKAVAWMVPYRC
jgi:hypothetical protein